MDCVGCEEPVGLAMYSLSTIKVDEKVIFLQKHFMFKN